MAKSISKSATQYLTFFIKTYKTTPPLDRESGGVSTV